ncbi:efflux RND transporter permease subunit [Cerasibacillus sp.]|uniref:efflux RND transporter permease subunit n=1 Tax=Cerasibacillus sp. TaxID=2498711 RepID=UPI0039C89D01
MIVRLLRFIVQRKILVGLMFVLVVAFGSYSIWKLDKALLPEVGLDGAYIEIMAGDMPAIEVEREITTPLEQKLQAIDGVENIYSTTNIGQSSIQVMFERHRGNELAKDVETIVQVTKAEVSTIEHVEVGQFGTNQDYEFFMDLSGGDMAEMTTFAKEVLEPRLEALPEVRDVFLGGLLEHEVMIKFNQKQLEENGLDVTQVIHLLDHAHSEATLGDLTKEVGSPSVRWDTSLDSVDGIKKTRIPTQTGFINLTDIATVSLQEKENASFVWKNGTKDFVFAQVGRANDVTQIEMAEAVRAEIDNLRKENLINGFELNEIVAQADYVQESLDGVTSNILVGGLIAIVVLLLFLRNIRATFIIGLSIPTSVLLTFTTMWMMGYSLNILTMIGLGLGIGMMVDSSIVILEAIYKRREQGVTGIKAVLEGTKEVASAVIASMLTTIVVFLPIGLIGGDGGKFVMMLSVVVAVTLISSVIVAFTLIPSLADKLLTLRQTKNPKRSGPILKAYERMVSWVIKKKRHSLVVIALMVIMFVGSLFLIPKVPMTIMPDMLNRYTELMIATEPGLSPAEREKLAQKINEKTRAVNDVESIYLMDSGDMFFAIINMTKGDAITTEQKTVNENIMSSIRSLEDNEPIETVQSAISGGGSGYPVQIDIKGDDFGELQAVASRFIKELRTIDGIVGVNHSMKRTSSEEVVYLKGKEIEKAGLSQLDIKQRIEQHFLNMPIGEATIDEEKVPLILTWQHETTTKQSLLDTKIVTQTGEKSLASFIELETVTTPNVISHRDGERYITVSADIEGRDLGAVNRDIQAKLDAFNIPSGYSITLAGDLEAQQELMMEMLLVIAIAIFLVYVVMAVQFNHFGHPLIVMSIIPMTIVGVIFGLFLTQMELSMMSGMGIIMLIGIVLNNAILLIDRTNQLRKVGMPVNAALIEAGKNRIRPIFMTTLTTVGGMLPLAIASGSSGNYQGPMATAIISGLLFATLITLLLIPAIYRLFTFSKAHQRKVETQKENVAQPDSAS